MTLYRATAEGNIPMTADEEAAFLAERAANAAIVIVPKIVTMRQARLALSNAGLLSSVNVAVSTLSEAIQITWEYAQEVRRDDHYVMSIGAELGLTSEQIDNLFIQAAAL